MQEHTSGFRVNKVTLSMLVPTKKSVHEWIIQINRSIKKEIRDRSLPADVRATRIRKLKFIRAEYQYIKEII